jgi:dihydrofolate synthase/folylpolyglutamate synthase
MQLLGSTLPEIAEEKAGIIKPGVPVVVAPQDEGAGVKIATIARERGARLRQVGRDWLIERGSSVGNKQSFTLKPSVELLEQIGTWEQEQFEIPLLGAHQVENASVAVAMMQELREQGYPISTDAIATGLATVNWPGRFEVMSKSNKIFILDCAHNHDSMKKLVGTLHEQYPKAKPILIFGASDDKDIRGMLRELLPTVSSVHIAKADHPRASDPEQLATTINTVAQECGVALSVNVAHTVGDALNSATADDGDLVLITGSIFLVADVRALLNSEV